MWLGSPQISYTDCVTIQAASSYSELAMSAVPFCIPVIYVSKLQSNLWVHGQWHKHYGSICHMCNWPGLSYRSGESRVHFRVDGRGTYSA